MYAVGFLIQGEDTIRYSADGRRFRSADECFGAVLHENKLALKTVKHMVVDTETGVAPAMVWKRTEVA